MHIHRFLSQLLLSQIFLWSISAVALATPHPHSGMATFVATALTTVWSWTTPSTWDTLWDTINDEQEKGRAFAALALQRVEAEYHDIGDALQRYSSVIQRSLEHSKELHVALESKIDLTAFMERLGEEAGKIVEVLEKEFEQPLPEEKEERARNRAALTSKALDMLEDAFVKICGEFNLPEEEARAKFQPFKRTVYEIVLSAGRIIDDHPELVEIMIITATCLIAPGILRVALRLFGFGPTGPVRGSVAAFLQRRFFGAIVEKDSWFAFFQRAGMVGGWWASLRAALSGLFKVLKSILL